MPDPIATTTSNHWKPGLPPAKMIAGPIVFRRKTADHLIEEYSKLEPRYRWTKQSLRPRSWQLIGWLKTA